MSRRCFARHCLAVFAVVLVASQARAAQPPVPAAAVPQQVRLVELANKASSSGPASLTPDEVVELHSSEPYLDPSGIGYFDELVWWWAAQGGLDNTAAASKLTAAFERRLGAVPSGFKERMVLALNGLPAAGRASYWPPAYVISGPAYRVQPVLVPGKASFGITEKDGISRRSILPLPPN